MLMALSAQTMDDFIEKLASFELRFGADNWTDETLSPKDLALLQGLVRDAGDFI